MPFHHFGKVNFVPYTKVDRFADFLKDGKLMGSRCTRCGEFSFPPRADCLACMSDGFEWVEVSGRGTLHTFTRIHAAPTGFEDMAPYTIGIADLDEGGRLMAWMDTPVDDIVIGMRVRAVPRIFEEIPEIRLYYTLEKE